MSRAFILVMDSFGLGASTDAPKYGDQGANTFGHIAAACAAGKADRAGLRAGPLKIPNLLRLGLGNASQGSSGVWPAGLEKIAPEAAFGFAAEQSAGKDTPSGHWEIAGLPVPYDWGFFPRSLPCFPADFTAAFIARAKLPGILGDCHASGTEIIKELGLEHIRTKKPICYTSADSVFQIAAHEQHFGLPRLYEICALAKEMLAPLNIARVIARPFVGETPETFIRTANRRDLTTPPHEPKIGRAHV
jgi:phosphopentomutase